MANRKNQMFAPSDGICWKCRHNIYKDIEIYVKGKYEISKGIKESTIKDTLITRCPHCSKSFVD